MKPILKFTALVLLLALTGNLSCKKEPSCEGCANNKENKPPIATAGPDQLITLPTDSVLLDGRTSSDPDGTISNYLWTKISGPSSSNITNSYEAKTIVKNLVSGIYQFGLKVTDDKGLSTSDTVRITVYNDSGKLEIIYNGVWGCNDLCQDGDVYWDSSPGNDSLYSDSSIALRVSIRLDTSSVWIDVHKINSPLPPINEFYWVIDRGFLWVFAFKGSLIGTSVTIKVNFL